MAVNWDKVFAPDLARRRATETDMARAARLGVAVTSVRKQRVARKIKAAARPGRPPSGNERLAVSLGRRELARLDAFAKVLGLDREAALARLTRSARSLLNGNSDERARYDRLLADADR